MVHERNAEHKVNLSTPTASIIIEAMRGICGLAVVRDYNQLGKYNLRLVCGLPPDDQSVGSTNVESTSQEDPAVNTGSAPDETTDIAEPKEE